MTELGELAKLIRSKNAGPFSLTIDIMFDSQGVYDRVVASGAINRPAIRQLYGTPEPDIEVFNCEAALAIKVSIPRPTIQGDLGDGDMMGGQQYGPLVTLDVP